LEIIGIGSRIEVASWESVPQFDDRFEANLRRLFVLLAVT